MRRCELYVSSWDFAAFSFLRTVVDQPVPAIKARQGRDARSRAGSIAERDAIAIGVAEAPIIQLQQSA